MKKILMPTLPLLLMMALNAQAGTAAADRTDAKDLMAKALSGFVAMNGAANLAAAKVIHEPAAKYVALASGDDDNDQDHDKRGNGLTGGGSGSCSSASATYSGDGKGLTFVE
ncbi:MAG: hypothetical protein HY075_04600 [Deltaproteobacteria bacterium]|nr:hypothetical protein [Deltaproteobacteria bacterium]